MISLPAFLLIDKTQAYLQEDVDDAQNIIHAVKHLGQVLPQWNTKPVLEVIRRSLRQVETNSELVL